MSQQQILIDSLKLSRPPWQHQGAEWFISQNVSDRLLLWDMGTGKTLTAVVWLRIKYRQRQEAGPTLVLAPLATLSGWAKEFKENTPASVSGGVVVAANHGRKKLSGAKRAELIAKPTSQIVITNWDSLNLPPVLAAIKQKKFKDIVADEIHRIKNHSSKRFKNLLSFSDGATNRLGLTGTLITNNYMDVWAPCRFVDKGRTFGINFYSQFRDKYFYNRNAGGFVDFPDWQPKRGIEEEISQRMASLASVKRKEECLSLPPRVVVRVDVALSTEQEKLYNEMAEDLVAESLSGDASATNALVKLLRIRQILAGFISVDRDVDDPSVQRIHLIRENPRLEALIDLLEDITPGAKVVVWTTFRANYPMLRAAVDKVLGYEGGYAELTGETKDRDAEIKRFQEDPRCRVFISNPQAGGTGVNGLQHAANYCIYFDRSHNAEHYWQSRDRIHRGGSEVHSKITEIHLVAGGTLDEDVLVALEKKENFADNIYERVRLRYAGRKV